MDVHLVQFAFICHTNTNFGFVSLPVQLHVYVFDNPTLLFLIDIVRSSSSRAIYRW
jgi:hypothetical protein